MMLKATYIAFLTVLLTIFLAPMAEIGYKRMRIDPKPRNRSDVQFQINSGSAFSSVLRGLSGLVEGSEINMNIVKLIESGNDTFAYNKYSQATGLYQITPICLKDYNQYHKIQYKMDDMFNPIFNKNVAYWYMNKRIPQLLHHYGKADTLENRLISYNCGISCVGRKLPRETKDYIKKYKGVIK